jgi:hypothetical protein
MVSSAAIGRDMSRLRFRIYASKDGNIFMAEIASLIAAALQDLEYDVDLLRDGLPSLRHDVVNLVVAPHEYFIFQRQYSVGQRLEAAQSCILVTTEQPSTQWFDEGLKYCRAAAGVLDINTSALPALLQRGIEAHHLPLGYHPSWDVWGRDALQPRPTDVIIMASSTPRRQAFIARHAEALAALNCDLRISRADVPAVRDRADFVAGRRKLETLARSKVLVNVHRGEHESFEWHRMLGAIANGCLVLSETAQDYAPLDPTEHFVMAPIDSLVDYATAYSLDEGSRRRIALQAHEFVVDRLSQTDLMRLVLPVIEDIRPKGRALHRLWSATFGSTSRADPDDFMTASMLAQLESPDEDPLAPPKAVAPASPGESKAPVGSVGSSDTWLRRILLNQQTLRRTVEVHASSITGRADYSVIKTAAFDAINPDVTVVVTLYNYARFIAPCLASVVGSAGVAPEIIIVDDHSSDGSVEVVLRCMDEYDDYPIMLVANHVNKGLPHARNRGFSLARTDHVFVLDADNLILAHTLMKLKAALDGSDAAFAYGIIAKFGRSQELMSCYPWDISRLVIDNYIDAMAMVRRSAWEAVGGYTTSDAVYGWEDYTLWLALADKGYRGELVREVVGLYREHGTSMLTLSNLDSGSAREHLRATFPSLPWEVPA